jgi:two-component system CheB/CheR fusion protein
VDFTVEPLEANADPLRLQQVVWNLVTNAIKFTPKGGRVSVSLDRVGGEAKLAVTDTGEGIAPDFLTHVFEMFRQADASATRAHGGMGIGLALVRQLTELHGGRVEAQSEGSGRGARFIVWLSLQEPDAVGQPQFVSPDVEGELSGVHILVVDDMPDALNVMRLLLSGKGAVVAPAQGAAEGLALAEKTQFDLVISDISLPGMDGYEFLQNLRSRPLYAKTPAIAVSGFGRESDVERARQAGYMTLMTKPIDFANLEQLVRLALGR